jgi:hypothetical protein
MRHRLATAGQELEKIFKPKAVDEIIKYADGNPRVINIICDNILIAGYGCQQKPISLNLVDEVIADFYGAKKETKSARKVLLPLGAAAAISALIAGAYQAELLPTIATIEGKLSALTSALPADFLTENKTEIENEPAPVIIDLLPAKTDQTTTESDVEKVLARKSPAAAKDSGSNTDESEVLLMPSSNDLQSSSPADVAVSNIPESSADSELTSGPVSSLPPQSVVSELADKYKKVFDKKVERAGSDPANQTISLMQVRDPETTTDNPAIVVENAEIVTIAENLEPATESIDEVLEPDDTEIENAVVAAQEKDTETISLPLDKVTVMEPEIETVESKNEPKNSATADDTSLKLATTTRSDFKRIEFNKDSKKTFPVTKIIQRGDEVFDLCTQVYGFCNAQVLALVKSNNPHIRNINVIYPNLKIIFPDLGQIKQIDRK